MKIDNIQLSGSYYTRTRRGKEYSWEAAVLVQFAKEKGYKPFDLPIDAIDFSGQCWVVSNMFEFAEHSLRIKNVDLSHPILLTDEGNICDGWHRIMRAVIEGRKYIKAIRLEEMPDYSSITELKDE